MAETFIPQYNFSEFQPNTGTNSNPYEFTERDLFPSSEETFHSLSDYKIESNLIYPSDLQDETTKMNYMIFHINVNQDSKFIGNYGTKDIPIRKSSGRFMDNASGALNEIVDGMTDLAKENVVKPIGTAIEKMTGTKSEDTNSFMYEQLDKLRDSAKEAVLQTMKPLKRLKCSIMLYMPQQVGTDYSMHYSSEYGLGLIGSLAESTKNGQAVQSALQASGRVLSRIGANMISNNVSILSKEIGLDTNISGNMTSAINAATRTTFNPRKEQLFQEVGFRQFTYHFKFAPRSQEECEQVMKIINMFKLHMHPEIDSSYFFYMYPSEFDIEYHIFDGGENPYINKISSCALQGLSISYGPGSNWATLINGCPTEISIALNFVELQPLHRKLLVEGGY